MEINAEYVIKNMPMARYRKLAKLFARHGTAEQHGDFLALLNGGLMKCKLLGATESDRIVKRYQRMRDVMEGLLS